MKVVLLGVLLLGAGLSLAADNPPDLRLVHGADYEGVIFTPEAMAASTNPTGVDPKHLWTPSTRLVKQAEAALPLAIAKKMRSPRHRGPNFPQPYTDKNGTNLHLTTEPRDLQPNPEYADDFLYDIHNDIPQYKRQYIGEVVKGRKVLLMSFIWNPDGWTAKPAGLEKWQSEWINVVDGGSSFWRVYYDPATKTFSDWDSNG